MFWLTVCTSATELATDPQEAVWDWRKKKVGNRGGRGREGNRNKTTEVEREATMLLPGGMVLVQLDDG